MDLLADGLLIVGALAAAFYCWTLSRRIKGLKELDSGVGGAIASLSARVDEMQTALKATQSVTDASVDNLEKTTRSAEKVARRLEGFLDEIDGLNLEAIRKEQAQPKPQKTRQQAAPKIASQAAPEQIDAKQKMITPLQFQRRGVAAEEAQDDRFSTAQKLQEDVHQRLIDRVSDVDSDELVMALQAALAKRTG